MSSNTLGAADEIDKNPSDIMDGIDPENLENFLKVIMENEDHSEDTNGTYLYKCAGDTYTTCRHYL